MIKRLLIVLVGIGAFIFVPYLIGIYLGDFIDKDSRPIIIDWMVGLIPIFGVIIICGFFLIIKELTIKAYKYIKNG